MIGSWLIGFEWGEVNKYCWLIEKGVIFVVLEVTLVINHVNCKLPIMSPWTIYIRYIYKSEINLKCYAMAYVAFGRDEWRIGERVKRGCLVEMKEN